MNELFMQLLQSTGFMASVGGLLASCRIAFKDATKHKIEKVTDIVIGALMSFAVSDYFANDSAKLSILLGLIVGTIGVSLLDAFQALSPSLAKKIADGVLRRFGILGEKEHD
ncbi:hypothetical protein [Basilea psittacipulmonis]|uniref:Holin n=1 Tax=Basilea psittacipulmonis DSM 24701 TaxID=1072685 RepID=A0A077DG01_9BURK|nr:hypothetical protein [Basilea psittacipulmonis]AIL33091.1 hypothetical protein IX83_07020 [Basilea psittacipulmonis DSM 24701]